MKPGIKTSEFWATMTTALTGLLVLFGVIQPEHQGAVSEAANQIIGAGMMVAPVIGYALSRGKAKAVEGPVKQ